MPAAHRQGRPAAQMDEQRSGSFHWGHAIRGVIAATIGTTIEWYDFFVYGMVASLVFELFFPRESPYIGTLLALPTFAAGFLTRPIGPAMFGHFGDRLGRKSTLTVTLLLTGVKIGSTTCGLVAISISVGTVQSTSRSRKGITRTYLPAPSDGSREGVGILLP